MSGRKLSPIQFEKLKRKIDSSIVEIFQNQSLKNRGNSPLIRLCEKTNEYKRQDKIKISKNKIKSIQQLLMIKVNSKKAHQQRMSNMDQYIQFTFNPFAIKSQQISNRESTERQQVSILQGIEKHKYSRRLEDIRLRLDQVHTNFQKRSKIIIKPEQFKRMSPQSAQVHQHLTASSKIPNNFLFLDSLLNHQQRDFNLFSNKNINLFQFCKNENHKDFQNLQQILLSKYFSRNSVISTSQPAQIIINHLSFIGRKTALNLTKRISNQYILSQNNIFINLDKLLFQEIMFISSGRLGWKVLYRYLSGYRNEVEENDMISDYHKRTNYIFELSAKQHNLSTIQNDIQALELIQKHGYLNFALTQNQQKQFVYSEENKQKLKQIMQVQNMLKAYNIKDIRLLEQIQRIKTEISSQQIKRKEQDKKIDIQKKVLMQKKTKGRQERIKNQVATEAFHKFKANQVDRIPKRKGRSQDQRVDISKTKKKSTQNWFNRIKSLSIEKNTIRSPKRIKNKRI